MDRVTPRVAAVFAVTIVASAAFIGGAPVAGAVSGIQTGYWSTLPAAPQVPAGGFEVGSNAGGAAAVAALRFTLGAGETPTKLTLKAAQAQPASEVAIEACFIAAKSASWQPPSGGGPGAISSAPTADCGSGVVGGVVASDGSTVTFDLTPLSFSGGVNLLLQPSQVASPAAAIPGAPSQVYPTFDASFDPLTSAEISVAVNPVSTPAQPPPSATQGANPAPVPSAAPPVGSVPLPPTTAGTSTDTGGAAPVVAAPQQSPLAQASPALVTHHRNLRLLFAIAMLSSDLLFLFLWMQHHQAENDVRPKLSIYDPPPPAASTTP